MTNIGDVLPESLSCPLMMNAHPEVFSAETALANIKPFCSVGPNRNEA
jgi:hypothetical protein